jgi:hypothetical protein
LLNVRINLNEECEDSFHRRYSPFLLLVRNGAAQAFVKLISVRIPPVFAPSMELRLGKQGDGVFLNVIYLKGPKRKFTRTFIGMLRARIRTTFNYTLQVCQTCKVVKS